MNQEERLLDQTLADDLAEQWQLVQTRFVDDPQDAVRAADTLVERAMTGITERLALTKAELETAWARDGRTDTEQLRRALQQYRTVLGGLLNR
jgi:hypothetical protein